jgi:5-methylcytosine-specific restriction endonuclease McrA
MTRHAATTRGIPLVAHNANAKLIYAGYRASAKKRGYDFDLSFEAFQTLARQHCFYCNAPPGNTGAQKSAHSKYAYSGIDRVDNSQGYTTDNCVASCKDCNLAKNNKPQSYFLNWVQRVSRHMENKAT